MLLHVVDSKFIVCYTAVTRLYYFVILIVAVTQQSLEAYQKATDLASVSRSLHPVRLGVALNFAVFCYEILCDPVKACHLAK